MIKALQNNYQVREWRARSAILPNVFLISRNRPIVDGRIFVQSVTAAN